MNGDYLLAERLIEVFRNESQALNSFTQVTRVGLANSYDRIADSIQQLLDEHNPPNKEQERDL